MCFWQVKVWDESGAISESPLGEWSMGLIQPADWSGAEWVGISGSPSETGTFPADARWMRATAAGNATFRKRFSLAQIPEQAQIHVATDRAYTLWLNGRHVMTGSAGAKEGQALNIAPYLLEGENFINVETASPGTETAQLLITSPLFQDSVWKVKTGGTSYRERLQFDDSAWPEVLVIDESNKPRWVSQDRPAPCTNAAEGFLHQACNQASHTASHRRRLS
ncbi:MAG: hypothetical protein HC845_14090 [Akkermansiaceae bacterium]|nr:hypothetical protein [Akkermansiaceae bacterium]